MLKSRAGIPSGLVVAALSAYAVIRLLALRLAGFAINPLRVYGPDVLAPLVLIPLFTWMQVWFGLRSSQQMISGGEILVYVSGMSLFYEGLLPLWNAHSVGDPLDVVAYVCGGVLLWMLRRQPASTGVVVPPVAAPNR
jgi:hypothetical protein